MPHPTPTVPDYVRLARHEWDLDDDGHEVIEHAKTVETDDTLVFAPDGLGGIAARAEAGGGGGVTGFATPAFVLGTAAAAGAATTVVRSDATIAAFDATAPTTSAIGDAAATGAVAKAARRDHVHGREALSTATPLVESGVGAVGTGVKSSREDHVHPAAAALGSGALVWVPLLANNPNIVTTDGLAVWQPLATVDGVPVLVQVAV